ncbi:MAG: hypothetical protein OEW80_13480, partial [Gemmatimonadota bacterium]|nr:hypothetical protein [Gemmatimonadota bacterium]
DGLGLVLRCFNASDDAVSGSWRLGRAPSTASRVRADGTVIEDIPLPHRVPLVPIAVAPRAMHTVKLTFDD